MCNCANNSEQGKNKRESHSNDNCTTTATRNAAMVYDHWRASKQRKAKITKRIALTQTAQTKTEKHTRAKQYITSDAPHAAMQWSATATIRTVKSMFGKDAIRSHAPVATQLKHRCTWIYCIHRGRMQ